MLSKQELNCQQIKAGTTIELPMWLGVMLAVSAGYVSVCVRGATILINLKKNARVAPAGHTELSHASPAASNQCVESRPEDG